MILDNINNWEKYTALNSGFVKAFHFLMSEDLNSLECGRYNIDGNDAYAMIQEYETRDLEESKYEAHKQYIDIQYLIKGSENMGYSQIDKLKVISPYNEESDFMTLTGETRLILYNPKEFFILFPEDAHMPGVLNVKKEKVRKAVIKIKVK